MKAGWEVKPLGEVCDILDKLRKPITKRDRIAGPYPYYGATGVLDHVKDFIFDEVLVLIGEDGAKWDAGENSAFAVEGKIWVNNHAHVLRPARSILLDEWLIYYLNYSDLSEFISGMTVPKLNQGMMKSIPIPLPPLEEQKRIVAVLDGAFDALTRARAHTEANLLNARELFEGHLASIFSDPPISWKVQKLQNYCEKITVGHVGSMSKRYTSTGIPFLRSQNVRPFHIDLDGVKYIDNEFNSELGKSELRPGDVAIVRTGYPGIAAVIPEDLLLANCSDLVIARTSDALEPQFLVMFLNSDFGKKMVARNSVGAAQKHFNVTAAKNVDFSAPSVPEQLKLISQIMKLKKKCKKLEAHYQQKLTDLDDLRQSLLQKAFAGELT